MGDARIVMAGADYKTAPVSVRERFATTSREAAEVLRRIYALPGVEGCALLSTCNRTELYLSWSGEEDPDPAAELCAALGLESSLAACFRRREERGAVMHLLMVSAGMRSLILGEDQILAQVKAAAEAAREAGTADGLLQSLFRVAVTGGKRVKTGVVFPRAGLSSAGRAVEALEDAAAGLAGRRALVIGNGEMGRLAAALLAERGADVTVTIRSYKRGVVAVPPDCGAVPYEERYRAMEDCHMVVSATASPHYTVTREGLGDLERIPRLFVDLAVPRDIQPEVARLEGVRCWNIDTLGGGSPRDCAPQLLEARRILEDQAERLEKWRSYRRSLVG